MPALQPNPFGAGHVPQRSEDRAVTNAKVMSQMLFGQIRGGIHCQAVRPFGVIKQIPDVFEIHRRSPPPAINAHTIHELTRNDHEDTKFGVFV
jgi:hypothetical protein